MKNKIFKIFFIFFFPIILLTGYFKFIKDNTSVDNDKLNDTARIHIMKNRFGPDGMTFGCSMNTTIGKLSTS